MDFSEFYSKYFSEAWFSSFIITSVHTFIIRSTKLVFIVN